MAFSRRFPLRRYTLLGAVFLALLYAVLAIRNATSSRWDRSSAVAPEKFVASAVRPACYGLPGSDDIVVVMKTGSTELRDKLPVHLETTIRCYTNYLIFSDFEETFEGELILDAFEFVDAKTKAEHDDFALWRRLQGSGRAAIRNLKSSDSNNSDGDPGENADKWKLLPMLHRTIQEYPGKRWYVFLETDTFIFWHSLLEYLGRLDWQPPRYLGAKINIDGIETALSGAGFVVSSAAMQQVVSMFNNHKREWEDFTNSHQAGEYILSKAFEEAGVHLLDAFPLFQSDPIGEMDYSTDKIWCRPTVSYRRTAPPIIRELFTYQEEFIIKSQASIHKPGYLSHKNVFETYVLPLTTQPRTDWDNHSNEDQGTVDSLEACRVICESISTCVQYSFNAAMHCFTTARPKAGDAARGIDSGWIHSRMENFFSNQVKCQDDTIWPDH